MLEINQETWDKTRFLDDNGSQYLLYRIPMVVLYLNVRVWTHFCFLNPILSSRGFPVHAWFRQASGLNARALFNSRSNFLYYPPTKTYHHTYRMPENPLSASEWPFGWEDIDSSGVPDAMAPWCSPRLDDCVYGALVLMG